jgi:hypothetical protein
MNGSIRLYRERIVIDSKALGVSKTYQLPLNRIRTVVVERKSVIPFATLTILAAALIGVTKYNLFWFLVNLSPAVAGFLSSTSLFASIICAVPVVLRTLFVSVTITWDGDPTSFSVGFVLVRPGKRLAKRFQESSLRSEAQTIG